MNNYGSLWSLITAREMGYMEEQGIELDLISFDTGPNIIAPWRAAASTSAT